MIGIEAIGIIRAVLAHLVLAVLDNFLAYLGGKRKILEICYLVGILSLVSIPEINAKVGEELGLRSYVCESLIVVRRGEGGEEGGNYSEKHKKAYDYTANYRALVLAEALERTLEVAYGLGIKLTVVVEVVLFREDELLRGNVIYIDIFHNYFAPILILGSMKP